jgi:hypothetical protein
VPELVYSGDLSGRFALITRALPRFAGRRAVTDDEVVDIALAIAAGELGGPRTHGDFAPWNILSDASAHWVIDWEASTDDLVPLFDLVHYFAQREALLRRGSAAAAARLLAAPHGPAERYLCALGLVWSDARPALVARMHNWNEVDTGRAHFMRAVVDRLPR